MRMNKCPKCGRYTLREKCCATTVSCHPPKFSIERDRKYGKYRRAGKK